MPELSKDPEFNCYCPPLREHSKRNTILILLVSLGVFILLMIIVWSPHGQDNKLYGLETSYWLGLAVGLNIAIVYNQSLSLYNMNKKTT